MSLSDPARRRVSRRGFLRCSTATAGATLVAGLASARHRRAGASEKAPIRPAVLGKAERAGACPPEVRAALNGPWPSIRTPFTREGQIDYVALRRLIDALIVAKAKALVLTWGDSLFSVLTEDEIAEVTKVVVQQANKRAMVVAADGSWWTGQTVAFARYCAEAGVDMLMVKPPDWSGSATLDTLVDHYRAVAAHIPVMLVTNFLAARGAAFAVQLFQRLCREVPGVMAVKDDLSGSIAARLCILSHQQWAFSAGGQKQNHFQLLPYGVGGYLSTFINFKPDTAWRYWNAVQAKDWEGAGRVIRDYDQPLFEYLMASEGGFDAAMHGIYELFGLTQRYRRLPYHSLSDLQMEQLAEFLRKRGIL